jgi:2-pyrone-4,6-dicarboxylate lactonase
MLNELPAGACDCHAHVFGPLDRFPFIAERSYTPAQTLPSDYREMLRSIGLTRGVVIQPSVFGADNAATLNAVKELGPNYRGVAVLRPEIGDRELADFMSAGVRGVRLSDLTTGGVPLSHLETMAARLKGSGWHIQIFANFSEDRELPTRIAKLGVPVVIDHLGVIDPAAGTSDPGFHAIVALLRDGLAWVKLSGAYISSKEKLPYPDVAPIASAYVAAAPDRLVWGSDWPHPAAPGAPPETRRLLELLAAWAPDVARRRQILVENPATLYGFPSP